VRDTMTRIPFRLEDRLARQVLRWHVALFQGLKEAAEEMAKHFGFRFERKTGFLVADADIEGIIRRLAELIGRRGPDAQELRRALNYQLIQAESGWLHRFAESGDPTLRGILASMTIPSAEVFKGKVDYMRELYLDEAVERVLGEQDELRAQFLLKVGEWIEGGAERLDVEEVLEQMRKTSATKARFFARDQYSRMERSLSLATIQQAEAPYVEVLSANDGRVRPSHREWNHAIYTPEGLLADPRWKDYNCILPGAKIQGKIVAGLKSFYSGSVIRIITTRGNKLSVTPNHPVFANGIWRNARDLREGDRLFCHKGNIEWTPLAMGVAWSPNKEYAPTSIEDVFGAFPRHGSVVGGAADFHGDEVFIKGDIEVASSTGFLPCDDHPLLGQYFSEFRLKSALASIGRDMGSFSGNSNGDGMFLRGIDHLSSFPSVATLTDDRLSVTFHERPLYTLSFGSASRIDAGIDQAAKDSRSTDHILFSKLLAADSGEILVDEVAIIENDTYTGHVYDLQSVTGWIMADNILVGNCRCAFVARWDLTAAQQARFVA
jgi:hypothetical protein